MSPRLKSGDRKLELLNVGRNLIFHEGPNRFTIRRLAEAVGITEPAIYRHFKNKEELLIELIHHMFEGWEEHLEALLLEPVPAADKLIRLGKYHLNHLIRHEFNPLLLVIEASAPDQPKIADALNQRGEVIIRAMASIINSAKVSGEFLPDLNVKSAVLAVMGVLQGSLIRWTLSRSTAGLTADVEGAIRIVVSGFSAGPSRESGSPTPPGRTKKRKERPT